MKVLQTLTHLNIGGITTYAYTLTKYLLRNKISVGIASSGGSWEEKFQKLGAKVFRININTKCEISPKLGLSIYQLYKIKKEFNFQIIHSHTRVAQLLSQIFSKLSGVPHIANFHGFYPKNKLRWGRKIFKAQGERSIAITPEVKNDLINIFGADKNKVKVIISGIDLERLEEKGLSMRLNGYPKIGSSGRLSEVKGFKYLLMSMPLILKKYPHAYLYILGKGKEEQNLLNLAEKLGIAERFKIIKNTELSCFLKAVDIFCLPSQEEPFGLSVAEAQYFGLPCIVSEIGGLKILVSHLNTGVLVPRENSEKIAQAVNMLMENPSLRSKISKNSRKQVIEKFDFSKKVMKFIEIYQEVLNLEFPQNS
ncbi:MAG: glycosyltransferase family 4 protein [Candidatus Omnitrophica bacterium]|nr:glycosyltransferase family 4 protein [Candidatus Omnitrophota bacterium]